jgi:hypothetical protein
MGRASREARQRVAMRHGLTPAPGGGRYRPKPDMAGYTPETEKARYERTKNGSTARRLWDHTSAGLTISY